MPEPRFEALPGWLICVWGGWTPYEGLATVAYCSHVLGMAALGLAIEFTLDNLHKLGQLRLELSQLWLALFGSVRHRGALSRVGVP